jgi:hypothetical protein
MLADAPTHTSTQLAERYGISQRSVQRIVKAHGVSCLINKPVTVARPGKPAKEAAPISSHIAMVPLAPPPVYFENAVLRVVVADPGVFNIRNLQANQVAHPVQFWLRYPAEPNQRLMVLWPDELTRPGLSRMLAYKSAQGERLASARECQLVEVGNEPAGQFYEQYHLQGRCNAGTHIGLRHGQQLVAIMSFNHGSTCRGSADHVLQRFAVAGSVPGAASRLLAAFRRDHAGSIVSYSDNRYATGGLYSALGFEKTAERGPDYRYWSPAEQRWYAKNQCQKKNLSAWLDKLGMAPTGTEWEMADQLGLLRCYDMGKVTWTLPA